MKKYFSMLALTAVAVLLPGTLAGVNWNSSAKLPANVKLTSVTGKTKCDRLGIWNIWPDYTAIAVDGAYNGKLPVKLEFTYSPADVAYSWLDGHFFSVYDKNGNAILRIDTVRRGRFRLTFNGKTKLSHPFRWDPTVIHWHNLKPEKLTVLLTEDSAALIRNGQTVVSITGKADAAMPLTVKMAALGKDKGAAGWYSDLAASAAPGMKMPSPVPPIGKPEWNKRVQKLEDFIYDDKSFCKDVPETGKVNYYKARRAALRLAVDALWFRMLRNNYVCMDIFAAEAEKLADEIRNGKQPDRTWKFDDSRRGKHFLAPDDTDFYGGVCGWGLASCAPEFAMMGINIVAEHVWPHAVSDNNGKFNDGMLIRRTMPNLDEFAKYNIRFDLMIAPYTPSWLLKKHPEWDGAFVGFGVENEKELLELHEKQWKGRLAGHGWLKASVIHPDYRNMCEEFLKNMLPYVTKHKAVVAIDLSNEIQFEDYTPEMQQRFREFLKKKYGSIRKLNAAWKSKYPNFDTIMMVRPLVFDRTVPERFWDWVLCNREVGTEHLKFLHDLCAKYAPGIPTHVKHLPYEFGMPWQGVQKSASNFYDYADGIDRMALAQMTPIIGTDSWADNGHDRYDRLESDAPYQTAYFSLLKGYAPDKWIFDSEWHVIRCDPPMTRPAVLNMIMQQNVVQGLKAGTFWVASPGINQKFDITSTPYVMLQGGITTAAIRENMDAFDAVARRPRQVGILYSPRSRAVDSAIHAGALLKLSEAMMFSGISFRLVDERQLINGEVSAKDVKFLFIPTCGEVDKRLLPVLKKFTRAGGKVFFGGAFSDMNGKQAAKKFNGQYADLDKSPIELLPQVRNIVKRAGLFPEIDVTLPDGKPAWGVEWHTARDKQGRKVIFITNMSKEDRTLVVSNIKSLTDARTGKAVSKTLKLKIWDTFIGYYQ